MKGLATIKMGRDKEKYSSKIKSQHFLNEALNEVV